MNLRYVPPPREPPDIYVTRFNTTMPDGTVVWTWAAVRASPHGDWADIQHFETKAEAEAEAARMRRLP